MTILISRHVVGEGPGYLAKFFDRQQIPYKVIKIDAGDALPDRLDGVSGLVFMGGPMSVNDPLPWIPKALRLIQLAIDSGKPVLGHCLGGQLISKALGGTVRPHSVREIGWFPVTASANTDAKRWLGDLGPQFEVFHWHGETFTIPAGASHILASEACENQAFVVGNTLALQCHVEMTTAMVQRWMETGANEICAGTSSIQDRVGLIDQLEMRVQRLHGVADVLYGRWLEGLS